MSVSASGRLFHRDGTSQRQRRLAEIDPLYAKLDDRELKDLLAFLWRMAEYVQYYDAGNKVNGHWQNFLGVEKAVLLALIATHDTSTMRRDTLDQVAGLPRGGDRAAYQTLFDLLYTHCLELQTLYESTRDVLGGQIFLSAENKRLLESFLVNLLVLYRRYRSDTASDYADSYTEQIESLGQDLTLTLMGTDPAPHPEATDADAFADHLREALYGLHQDLQKLFGTVMAHAEQQLQIELARRADFQPHVGLILGFLELFRRYQDQLNGLTARHLMFYYRDILKIDYRQKIADRAFLIIELAKHVDACRLEEGTLFSAGKDAAGQPLAYAAAQEFVANKAQVSQLKSLYRYSDRLAEDGREQPIGRSGIPFKRIKAAVMADSLDGAGEALDPDQPQFHPFGGSDVMADATLGFALASPVLRLASGRRVITLAVELTETLLTEDANMTQVLAELADGLPAMFELSLSCASGWRVLSRETLAAEDFSVQLQSAASGNPQIGISCTLDRDFPAVVDISAALHGAQFPEDRPVCQVIVRQTDDGSLYELCRRMSFVSCEVTVDVSQLQPLVLQNDLGTLKPEKPMMVFGNQPRGEAIFYIGHTEAFSKALTGLTISWDWIEFVDDLATWYAGYTQVPETFPTIEVAFERLVDNTWQSIDADEADLPSFYVKQACIEAEEDAAEDDTVAEETLPDVCFSLAPENATNRFKTLEPVKQYSLAVQDGFVRMVLQDNGFLFGHRNYAESLMASFSSSSTVDDAGVVTVTSGFAPINPPITPSIQNVQLEYTARASLTVGQGSDTLHFFHIHPFGVSRETVDASPDATGYPLVHDISAEGSFYIGLAALAPPQSVSLLFQFVDGTGDLGLAMPDDVQWSYLSASGWQVFDERGVLSDGTSKLSGTGIVSLAMPVEAVSHNTIMPVDLFWIRVSVPANGRAVNKLASLSAQAMEVVLKDQDNDVAHYQQALAAGTIAKLVESNPQVKAVTQPFASFDGRPPEKQDTYCVRVSERLRHKDRAVTLWDYEHLVLDQFPQIHKVTCLNHVNADAESQPGHVLVIVIPSLENLNAVNILQPSVSMGLREKIHGYLTDRCSTFVELHVANPTFEQLKVICNAIFCQGCDVGYYNSQLSQDIRAFLTPWKQNYEAIRFSEKLHSSVILNFIEERPYVDYLTRFLVQKTIVGVAAAQADEDSEEPISLGDIVRSRTDALFVSAQKHAINEIAQESD